MNGHNVLLYLYQHGLEYDWSIFLDSRYQWLMLGSGLSAATIFLLSWFAEQEKTRIEPELEIESLQNNVDQMATEIGKLKRNVEALNMNYQQIVDFLKSDE